MMIVADLARRTTAVASDASDMMPPSPSLSARITMRTYFRETITVRVQKTSERAPSTRSVVTGMSWAPRKISPNA